MPEPNRVTGDQGPESRWSQMVIALRYRNFRLVWLGSVTEHVGEFMELAAILWLVNELTHSPLMLTVVGSARFMPLIFTPLVGGVVADRVNRRSLLIAALLGGALLSIGLIALAFTGRLTVLPLFIISLLHGVATNFNHPARQAIVPNLVKKEHLLNAISLDTITVQVGVMLGMPLAGYLIGVVGVWPIFVLKILGALLAVFWLLQAKIPPTPPATRNESPRHNLIEGLRYLRGNTTIMTLLLIFPMPWLAQYAYTNFMPVFTSDILHLGALGYGFFQGAPGIGTIISLIALTLLTYYKHKFRLLIGIGIILSIGLIGFAVSPWVWLSFSLLVIVGGMRTMFLAVDTTIIQNLVPDEVRGRVMSWREVAMAIGPTGSILFGAIAMYTGVPFSLGLLGGLCLIFSLSLILLLPRFRDVK